MFPPNLERPDQIRSFGFCFMKIPPAVFCTVKERVIDISIAGEDHPSGTPLDLFSHP